jgi:uncharacterized Rossmann fold enzyme
MDTTQGTAMREEHIAWMEEHIRMLRDQILIIEDGSARYFWARDGEPSVDVTDETLADNKRRLAELERLLGGHQ